MLTTAEVPAQPPTPSTRYANLRFTYKPRGAKHTRRQRQLNHMWRNEYLASIRIAMTTRPF